MNPRLLALPLALLLPGRLAAATPPAPVRDAPVELSPFVVSTQTERGYAAANTLDGSRLNTPLRDTPASISVFTRDFLDDLGATSMEEILRYDLTDVIPEIRAA
jgi:outer membrane receptor protein involved in Fe transport